jgi:hypothetical protein
MRLLSLCSLLPLLAAASPAIYQDGEVPMGVPPAGSFAVTIIAIHSGSPIQYQAVNASGQRFWLGKPTSTYCPSVPGACPAGNTTALVIGGKKANMGALKPLPFSFSCFIFFILFSFLFFFFFSLFF